MISTSLRLLSTGCALVALMVAAPSLAQDVPASQMPDAGVPTQADPAVLPPSIVVEAPPIDRTTEPEAPAIPAVWSPIPETADGQSAYGLYLSGRLASFRGDRTTGAALLAEAQSLVPEQPVLADEAFREGLFAGDLDEVARLTPLVSQTPQLAEAGRFTDVVQSLQRGDARRAQAIIQQGGFSDFFGVGVRFLTPIAAAGAGDWLTALTPVVVAPQDPSAFILRLNRAQLLERRRQFEAAEAEYKVLLETPVGSRFAAEAYGGFLERRRRKDEAVAVYDAALAAGPADPAVVAARARATGRGRAPAMVSLNDLAADALNFIAGGAKQAEAGDLAIIYLRLAQSLRPDNLTAYELGEALAKAERELPAREAFGSVTTADPLIYAEAQYSIAESFIRDEQGAQALEAFRRADAAAPDQPRMALALSGQLLGEGFTEEALGVLNRPTINTADQHPLIRFQRGAALERLGRLDEAEAELWTALQAAPDNATILNFLGYMWVDTGRRVDEGAAMLARAHAAAPEDGNIQDSLGWAQYRQGQYETAVVTLEAAVEKEPANAEINDHLGDAYWKIGRQREAQWQWTRVLTLDPDAERRTEIERKLVDGLTETTPTPTPVVGG
ncbi:tetratricopeptide repeat protein [Brevundimonas sp.]